MTLRKLANQISKEVGIKPRYVMAMLKVLVRMTTSAMLEEGPEYELTSVHGPIRDEAYKAYNQIKF